MSKKTQNGNGDGVGIAEMDSALARAAIEREKEMRAQQAIEAINTVCQKYRVVLVPRVVIMGTQMQADVQVMAQD
jgi:hypothetical protein